MQSAETIAAGGCKANQTLWEWLLTSLVVFAGFIFRAIIGLVSIVRSGLSKGHE